MALHIGTSGWSYNHWEGVLYPPGTPVHARLRLYVASFPTVEINATFYRWPNSATFQSWHKRLTMDAKPTTWPAHDEGVAAIAFSADGKQLATSSASGEVKIWDSATRREILRIEPVGHYLIRLEFSPDGKLLAAEPARADGFGFGTRPRDAKLPNSGIMASPCSH